MRRYSGSKRGPALSLCLLGVLAVADDWFTAPSRVVIGGLSRTSFCDCADVGALPTVGTDAARTGAGLLIVARSGAPRTFELNRPGSAQRGPPARGSPLSGMFSYRRTGAAGSVRLPGQKLAP